MSKSMMIVLALLIGVPTAVQAEILRLACRYESGAFTGERLSVTVDLSASTLIWAERGGDFGTERADITEQYISVPPGQRWGRRIDRVTGIVSFLLPEEGQATAWDSTVFGRPGLVCQRATGF